MNGLKKRKAIIAYRCLPQKQLTPPNPMQSAFTPSNVLKNMQSFLTECDVPFPKTHSLAYLVRACAELDKEFEKHKKDFEDLDEYSVDIRYPGDDASEDDARKAVESMKRARAFIRSKLNLPEDSSKEGNDSSK